jgi:hypothetical protein
VQFPITIAMAIADHGPFGLFLAGRSAAGGRSQARKFSYSTIAETTISVLQRQALGVQHITLLPKYIEDILWDGDTVERVLGVVPRCQS